MRQGRMREDAMDVTMPRTAAQEWRSHWTVVFAGLLGFSLSAIGSISLGVFTQPLQTAFGWSRSEVASGLLAYSITFVVTSPIFGNLVDRFGPRRTGIPGVILVGLSFALFATATGSLIDWLFLWAVFALFSQAAKATIWTAAVASEFHASRGLALAVTLAGSGVGNSFAQLSSYYLINAVGWRLAYLILGLGWGGVVALACYFFLWGRSDRLRVSSATSKAPAEILSGMTTREGLRTWNFVALAGAAFCGELLVGAMMMQLVPVLTGTGLNRADAAWIGGAIGITTIVGKLICGALVDHLPGKYIAAVVIALPVITCGALLTPSSDPMARLIPMTAFGLSVGGLIHMLPYLTTRYFGLKSFGTIFGFIGSIIAIAVGLGPFFSGWVFDVTRNYDLVMIGGIVVSIAGALLLLSLGRYPDAPVKADRKANLAAAEPIPAE
jgi:MFS family permease